MSTSRIDDLRMVDPVLTTVAQEYQNASTVAEFLFPTVKVSKLKGKIPVFGKGSFTVKENLRALRAGSNRIEPEDIEMVEFNTTERDLETAIDYIEEEESPDFFRYEQRIAKQLTDMMSLVKEKEAADFVQDEANYSNDLKYEVPEYEAFNDYSLPVDPILVIRNAMNSVRAKIARYPNTMIIGDSAYNILISHPKIIDRIKYAGLTKINTSILSQLLEIPIVKVGMSVYTENGTDFLDVWKDNIVLAYVDSSEKGKRSEFNPSFGYTFQREGKPEIDTYYENGGKLKVIRSTDNYAIKVTGSDAAFLIKNTNSAEV